MNPLNTNGDRVIDQLEALSKEFLGTENSELRNLVALETRDQLARARHPGYGPVSDERIAEIVDTELITAIRSLPKRPLEGEIPSTGWGGGK